MLENSEQLNIKRAKNKKKVQQKLKSNELIVGGEGIQPEIIGEDWRGEDHWGTKCLIVQK